MFRRSDFTKVVAFDNKLGGKKTTKIFRVKHNKTGKLYILKEIEARSLEKLNEYKEEAVQLTKVQNHPGVMQFYGFYFYETPHNTYKLGLICEHLNEKENLEIMYRFREQRRAYWKEEELLKLMHSMIDVLAYLQVMGICHRDIKPANLFVVENFQIKVIDFGESKEYKLDEEDDLTMATIRGTPQYLSPVLWRAHVLNPGTKVVEHNIYKSDVFSSGLVLFQMAAMKDVTGFNQRTEGVDGEKLIKEGLDRLSRKYSNKVVDVLRQMLIFDEESRPHFIDLGKYVFGEDYDPKTGKGVRNGGVDLGSSNNKLAKSTSIKTTDDKALLFKQYMENHHLKFNMNKITFWFEYGGNMIGKFYLNKEESKWKLIAKYKSEFPGHFISVFIDEDYGHFLIGGVDNNNTFQYRDGQIVKKASMNIERSFMSVVYVNKMILAIGGYEYNDKNQLGSIEVYDIEEDKWALGVFEDLKVQRSQAHALVFNSTSIFVFGGYNKNNGTLSSLERINLSTKKIDLLDIKLPIPLRRFTSIKISETKILIMGGVTTLCKESDTVYCLDLEKSSFSKFSSLPKAGIIDHEVLLDEQGQVHLFFENNYGTSPPVHVIYNYLDFNN